MAKKKAVRAKAPRTRGGTAHFEIKDHFAAIARVRKGLQIALLKLPAPSEASGIKEVAPNCAVAKYSDLHKNNWSPETYMFSQQYMRIAQLVVARGAPETVIKRLLQVLRAGKLPINAGPPAYTITLHPEVITNVRKMLKESV